MSCPARGPSLNLVPVIAADGCWLLACGPSVFLKHVVSVTENLYMTKRQRKSALGGWVDTGISLPALGEGSWPRFQSGGRCQVSCGGTDDLFRLDFS